MSTLTTTTTKTMNPLQELAKYGQSVWLDYIRRNLITSGELKRMIDEDGLGGVTSNPAIFEKAITGSTDYADALVELQKRKDLDAIGDLRNAGYKRYPGCRRRFAPGLRPDQEARRLRKPGGFAVPGARYGRHHQGRSAAVEGRESAEPDGEDPRHHRRNSRHPAVHQRRHQHQRHPSVRAGNV